MSKLSETVRENFAGRRIVILGDLVADQFLHGTISRVSREAPVFILNHDFTDTRPGAAANAAANVAALGGQPILVGLTGNDENGRLLRDSLERYGVDCSRVISDERLRTTTKIRVLAGQHYAPRQQVIRIDYLDGEGLAENVKIELAERFAEACEEAEAIIISDYNCGAGDPAFLEFAHAHAVKTRVPLLIDSRYRLSEFAGATAATPNQEEVESILGKDLTAEGCEALRKRLDLKALLVTRGNKGMTLFEEGKPARTLDAIGAKEPVDVTGAGDTVIGTFALGLASGLSFADAAIVSNHAGGIVVMKRGTATASADELIASLEPAHTEADQAAG